MKSDAAVHLKRASVTSKLVNLLLILTNVRKKGVFIGKGSVLGADVVEIGTGTRINGRIVIKGGGLVSLGNYCALGDGVRIISTNHSIHAAAVQLALQKKMTGSFQVMPEKQGVTIGHDVWIGDSAIILPGVNIGNGAVVGAGAVVTRSIEPYGVVAGNPARPIGRRFSEAVAQGLESLQWWHWNDQQFQEASFLFAQSFAGMEDSQAMKIIEQARQETAGI